MCLLILAKGGSTPSKKSLRRAGVANPDGFGFAIIGDRMLHTFKSMNLEETIGNFFDMRQRYPKGHAIFHLRITTHGVTNIDNCHPFQVNDDIVMGHNGMLPIKEENGKSDTNLFATEWLPQFDIADLLDTKSGVDELEKFAMGSKLAFLNVGSELAKPFYIINEHLGHWKDGVWYSNSSYNERTWYPSYTTTSYTSGTSPYYVSPYNRGADPRDVRWDDDDLWADVQPDDRSVFETEEAIVDSYSYRSWNVNDLVFDHLSGEWVHPDLVDELSDIVQWECNHCGHQAVIDLVTDEVDLCTECGTCYFCDCNVDSCRCAHEALEQ